nr:hypothetical protein TQ38_24715 [Novosphingobium sp. P6W]
MEYRSIGRRGGMKSLRTLYRLFFEAMLWNPSLGKHMARATMRMVSRIPAIWCFGGHCPQKIWHF